MKNNFLIFFYIILFLSACTHTVQMQSLPGLHPSAKEQLQTIVYQYKKKQISDFIFVQNLKKIENNYPNTYSFFKAIFLQSQIAKKNKNFNLQIHLLQKIALSNYRSPLIENAIIELIKIYEEKKHYQFAISFILKLEINRLNKKFQNYLYSKLFKYNYYLQKYFSTLFWGQKLSNNKALSFSIKKQISWIIKKKLNKKEIKKLIDEDKYPEFTILAFMKYGKQLLLKNNLSEAKKIFSTLYKKSKDSNEKQEAFSFLQKINKYKKINKNKIGLIVPLTGKYKKIGRAIVNAVSLGLGIWNKKNNSWLELVIEDSRGSKQHTELVLNKLLSKDHVIAIIGNPLSRTSKLVAKTATQFKIPYISLSQSPNITANSPYVFRNAITSKMQLKILVNTIKENFKIKNWGILYPNDNYGTKHANLFWDIILNNQQSIMAAQTYSSKEKDFNKEIQRLTGLYFLEDRKEEYKEALKKYLKHNKKKRRSSKIFEESLLKPKLQFKALFIPDTLKSLIQISNMLIYYQIDEIILLGTNLWNKQKLVKLLPKYAAPILFVNSSLTYKKKIQSNFYKVFKKTFNTRPHLLASYAYEAAKLMKEVLTKNNIDSREGLQKAMSKISKFSGAFEDIKISKEGEFIRLLSLFKIHKNKISLYKKNTNSL